MTDRFKEILEEWAINFIKSKDALNGNLKSIDKDKEGFGLKAVYNDKEELIIIEPFVKDPEKIIQKIQRDKITVVFMFNSLENFNFLINSWKRLADFQKLTLYFVNMFSSSDKRWAIKPYLHNLISDNKSFKEGLNSMFVMVEPIDEKILEGKIYK